VAFTDTSVLVPFGLAAQKLPVAPTVSLPAGETVFAEGLVIDDCERFASGFLLNSAMRSVSDWGALLNEGSGCDAGAGTLDPFTVMDTFATLGVWEAFCVRLGFVKTKYTSWGEAPGSTV
jgi:hypothetical protein